MATLPEQLERLEAAVTRAGGTVHWARDGAEATAIVARIAEGKGAREVIKVKSLATDEIDLNEGLHARGIEAIETDLAELIIQLAGDKQSHILVPAIVTWLECAGTPRGEFARLGEDMVGTPSFPMSWTSAPVATASNSGPSTSATRASDMA